MNSAAVVLIIAVMATAIVVAAKIINKRGAGHLPASVSDEKVDGKTRKHPLAGSNKITTEPWGPEGRKTLEDFDWPVPLEEVKARFRSLAAPNDCPQDS